VANNGPDKIKVKTNNGQIFYVIGKEFSGILGSIKTVQGRKFDGDSKTWNLPFDRNGLNSFLEEHGLQTAGSEDDTLDEFFADGDSQSNNTKPQTELATTNKKQDVRLAKKQKAELQQIYTEKELRNLLNITDHGLPEYGVDGETLLRTIMATMLYHENKGVSGREKEDVIGLHPHEALILTINAIRMGVNTSSFSCWKKSDGTVETHLSYHVAQTWIRYCIPECIIHNFEITNEDAEYVSHTENKYTVNAVNDIVYKSCLLTPDQAKEARVLANEIRCEFRESRKLTKTILLPSEYKKEWDMAQNMAFEQCATATGVGVLEATEVYYTETESYTGKDGKKKWKDVRDEKGHVKIQTYGKSNSVPKRRKPNPKGRGNGFIAQKRATTDAAMKLGAINLRDVDKSHHKFNPKVIEFLADNPEYDTVSDSEPAKQHALAQIGGKKSEYEDIPFEGRVDLLRGDEQENEGID